jgi:hypothetical protein
MVVNNLEISTPNIIAFGYAFCAEFCTKHEMGGVLVAACVRYYVCF